MCAQTRIYPIMLILIRFLVLIFAFYILMRMLRRMFSPTQRQQHVPKENQKPDPYEVLGIHRGASKDEIEKAYKKALTRYHPDKVEHLGEDLQQLAKEKTRHITEAFEELR